MCKRFSRFFAILVTSAITFALCSAGALNAFAALSGGQYMTTQQALDIFGSSIPCQYFNGSDYVDGTFLYDSSYQLTSYNSRSVTDYISARPYFLRYVATLNNVSTDRSYITVDVRPSYSIFDTSQLHTAIALSTGSVLPGGSFDSPSWEWYWGGSSVHLENNVLQQGTNGYRATLYIANSNCTYVPCDFSSQSATSGYSVRACFCGNSGINTNQYYLYIGVPYVDADASGMNGTSTSATAGSGGSSSDVNVTVDVDMSETNGLLGTIWDAISGIPDAIIDGLESLFIPDEDFFEDTIEDFSILFAWYEEIEETKEHFAVVMGQEQENEAPIITFDTSHFISSTTGQPYMNESSYILDMTPLVPYIGTIRAVLSFILWIFFLWRLYCKLPDIIRGAGMATPDDYKSGDTKDKGDKK